MYNEVIKPQLTEYLYRKAYISKTPLSGAFEISPLCNMDCKMCYVRMSKEEMNKVGRQRTVDEWIEIAEQAKEMGTLFILLTGGEPFLYKDFKELGSYTACKEKGVTRLEGKEYIVQDGDLVHFRFNV